MLPLLFWFVSAAFFFLHCWFRLRFHCHHSSSTHCVPRQKVQKHLSWNPFLCMCVWLWCTYLEPRVSNHSFLINRLRCEHRVHSQKVFFILKSPKTTKNKEMSESLETRFGLLVTFRWLCTAPRVVKKTLLVAFCLKLQPLLFTPNCSSKIC